jgi:hypothetical protein
VGLTDIAGVLSRKFIVGFLLPAFFGCLALKLLVADAAIPSGLRDAGGATQILIIGGVALLLGLLLWGVHYPMIRVLEGYWLIAPTLPDREPPRGDIQPLERPGTFAVRARKAARAPARFLNRKRLALGEWKKNRWVRTMRHLVAIKEQPEQSRERTHAARELSTRYPPEDRFVLPTELGNVIRAFENHPRDRYGLDGIPIWPSIVTMLSDSEISELEEATTDVAFWLNSFVAVLAGGALLLLERLWHPPGGVIQSILIELAIAVAVLALATWMYRQLVAAAARWGEPVRAAFDVHRLELYDKFGLRRPLTAAEDVAVGKAINRLIMFGEPLPDEWRAAAADNGSDNEVRVSWKRG